MLALHRCDFINTMINTKPDGKKALLVFLAIAAVFLALTGALAYRNNRQNANTSLTGKINITDCTYAGVGCQEQQLYAEDGKVYGIVGRDARPYNGDNVEIEGAIKKSSFGVMDLEYIEADSIKLTGDNNTQDQDVTPTQLSPTPPTPTPPSPVGKDPSSQSDFDAQSFYDQVQSGMTHDEVRTIAGSFGDCSTTDVYPPSGYMYCTWSDKSLSVTVTFYEHVVTSKSKSET